jgi:hypothetical protein
MLQTILSIQTMMGQSKSPEQVVQMNLDCYNNSSAVSFILPYSKTKVWLPIFQFMMRTPNFQADPKGIRPDVEIQIEPDDWQSGFDRLLNFVIKAIANKDE